MPRSCRRRDASTPATNPYLSLALANPDHIPPQHPTLSDLFGETIPTYVPALQPTPPSFPDARIHPVDHEGKSDLDPTEWKPAELELGVDKSEENVQSNVRKPRLQHRPSSEAFNFLSRFHTSSDRSKRCTGLGQKQSTITRGTPSLSHTPTSSEESLVGTPYEFVTRPAISMPTTSAASHVITGDKAPKAGEVLNYEKQVVGSGLGGASGSLKRLLGTRATES